MFRNTCVMGLISLALVSARTMVTKAETVNLALNKPVTGSSYYQTSVDESFPFDNIVDGRLDDTGTPGDWSFWLTPTGVPEGFFTIDLEAPYLVQSFSLQNTHNRQYNDRGTKDFHVDLSVDDLTYATVVTDTLAFDTGTSIEIVDFDISDRPARYVRFYMDSYYYFGDISLGSGGLNEIWVWGEPAPIPEPSSVVGLAALLGMGLFGYLWRRHSFPAE